MRAEPPFISVVFGGLRNVLRPITEELMRMWWTIDLTYFLVLQIMHVPPLLSSPLLFAPLLSSPLLLSSHPSSQLSPSSLILSVRFVLWLKGLNLLTKHTKSCTCKGRHTLYTLRHTLFTTSCAVCVLWAAFKFKTGAASARLWQIRPELILMPPQINSITSFYWRCGSQWGFIKSLAAISHLLIITN